MLRMPAVAVLHAAHGHLPDHPTLILRAEQDLVSTRVLSGPQIEAVIYTMMRFGRVLGGEGGACPGAPTPLLVMQVLKPSALAAHALEGPVL